MRDLISNLDIKATQKVLVKTATDKLAYTDSIDTKGMGKVGWLGTMQDTTSGTDVAYTPTIYDDISVTVQESDDDVTFTDLDSSKQLGKTALDAYINKIGAVSCKRYLRLKITGTSLGTIANNKLKFDAYALCEYLVIPQA